MADRINLDRKGFAKGSQPVVFGDQTTDALAGMVLALLGEVMVLKDRLDANERMLAGARLHGPDDVDHYQPDAAARAYRNAYRQGCYDRVLGAARDRLLPEALAEHQAFESELAQVSVAD